MFADLYFPLCHYQPREAKGSSCGGSAVHGRMRSCTVAGFVLKIMKRAGNLCYPRALGLLSRPGNPYCPPAPGPFQGQATKEIVYLGYLIHSGTDHNQRSSEVTTNLKDKQAFHSTKLKQSATLFRLKKSRVYHKGSLFYPLCSNLNTILTCCSSRGVESRSMNLPQLTRHDCRYLGPRTRVLHGRSHLYITSPTG